MRISSCCHHFETRDRYNPWSDRSKRRQTVNTLHNDTIDKMLDENPHVLDAVAFFYQVRLSEETSLFLSVN